MILLVFGMTAFGETVTLKVVLQIPPTVELQNNPILKKAEELTGIHLDIEAPPVNSYFDRCRILAASGEFPDFFLNGTDTDFENWSRQGMLAVLDDKLSEDKYPNLMKNITPERWGDTTASSTGKIHAVPRPNNVDLWGYIINNKWLENLNLTAPRTLDEFFEVAKAFTFDDPDGNGKNDTYGFTTQGEIFHLRTEYIKTAYNLSIHYGVPTENGEYLLRCWKPGYIEYLTFLKKCYSEGILEPEFFTNKQELDREKFLMDRVGIIGGSQKDVIDDIIETGMPIGKYSYHAPLAKEEGDKGKFIVPPSNWCAFLVSSSSSKVDDVLRFLDFANSEEGFKLFKIGIKGVHYNSYDIDTRQIDRTPEQLSLLNKQTSSMMTFANAYLDRAAVEGGDTEQTREIFQTELANAEKITDKVYTPFVKSYDAFFSQIPDVEEKIRQMEIQYITGSFSKDDFMNYIENEYKPRTSDYAKEYKEYMESLK